ncbi:HU family DNA-binding protein [Parabacteroides sp. Marseille-P3160]|uniref:HU family DNA-binding protein n=1 Tax=Parabacteroides sp. Marseille-P3160 TaxID=1917887 RepID=UPI0009BC2AD5|nr:HU family DNA-binding protein [Parabacteroides sp. Marseille-P3160]
MKEKELIIDLSNRLATPEKEVEEMLSAFKEVLNESLANNDPVMIQGLGVFEVKKKAERISVNPTNGKRYLVPPKLVPVFKPSTTLKEKYKTFDNDE